MSNEINAKIQSPEGRMGIPRVREDYLGRKLKSGKILSKGQFIKTESGKNTLIYQTAGNLVLYSEEGSLWASDTGNQDHIDQVIMQDDGNFVMYKTGHEAVKSTKTGDNHGREIYAMVNDGHWSLNDDVTLWGQDQPVEMWSSTDGSFPDS